MAEMNENVMTRVVPHNIEAEQSVIGSMLRDKDAVITAAEILTAQDFYQKQYSLMYEAMMELYREGQTVDLVTVQERLKKNGAPAEVSDISAFRAIMQSVATSANIRAYSNIVKEKAILRNLIKVNADIANLCYAGEDSLDDILGETEKKIFHLLEERQGSNDMESIDKIAFHVLQNIQAAARNGGAITGIPSGFTDLDYKLAGFQNSDFILVAARPSMGKTAFVLNILDTVSVKKKMNCMVFSLEMSREQLVNRILSMESLVDADRLRKGNLDDNDWAKVIEAADRISDSHIIIDDTPGISVPELRSKCRKTVLEKGGISLVIIDYLQLMTGSSKRSSDSRQQEISDISRSLKALARELKCPVIALSQLSRAPEQRPDHRPMLSDLRESGAIEQDADVVMFLYRDEYYTKEQCEHPGEAEVIIAKQRNGPIGTVVLGWQAQYTRFVNLARSNQYQSE